MYNNTDVNNYFDKYSFLWIYSSKYGNKWECYNADLCLEIEEKYKNYFNFINNEKENNENNEIEINEISYYIDFDNFLQINTIFPEKKRKMKRIKLKDKSNIKEIFDKYNIKYNKK